MTDSVSIGSLHPVARKEDGTSARRLNRAGTGQQCGSDAQAMKPIVVSRPLILKQSLIETGRPWSGPTVLPSLAR